MRNSPKDFYKKLLGISGEKRAAKFLEKAGYKILDKNYRTKAGEIDIVAKDKDAVVFIEVKTRSDESFGRPAEAVDFKKREKYVKAAQEYLIKKFATVDVYSRFDVIEIEKEKINHIINAFFA